jgi:hypothetical protein
VLVAIQIAVFMAYPFPDTVTGWFGLLQDNALAGLVNLDLLLVVDNALLVVIALALYVALRGVSPSITSHSVPRGIQHGRLVACYSGSGQWAGEGRTGVGPPADPLAAKADVVVCDIGIDHHIARWRCQVSPKSRPSPPAAGKGFIPLNNRGRRAF